MGMEAVSAGVVEQRRRAPRPVLRQRLRQREGARVRIALKDAQAARSGRMELAAAERQARQPREQVRLDVGAGRVGVAAGQLPEIFKPHRRVRFFPLQREVAARPRAHGAQPDPVLLARLGAEDHFDGGRRRGALAGQRGCRPAAACPGRAPADADQLERSVGGDLVNGQREGQAGVFQVKAAPAGGRRFPGPPQGGMAQAVDALARLDGGECVRAGGRTGRSRKPRRVRRSVVGRRSSPGQRREQLAGPECAVVGDGQTHRDPVAAVLHGVERELEGRGLGAGGAGELKAAQRFPGKRRNQQFGMRGIVKAPGVGAALRRRPAPPPRAHAGFGRLAGLHRGFPVHAHLVGRRYGPIELLGPGEVVVAVPFLLVVLPRKFIRGPGKEGRHGGNGDVVLVTGAHRKLGAVVREVRNQAERGNRIAGEGHDQSAAGAEPDRAVLRRRPAVPDAGGQRTQPLAGLQRGALVVAFGAAFGAIDRRGEAEIVIGRPFRRRPAQRQGLGRAGAGRAGIDGAPRRTAYAHVIACAFLGVKAPVFRLHAFEAGNAVAPVRSQVDGLGDGRAPAQGEPELAVRRGGPCVPCRRCRPARRRRPDRRGAPCLGIAGALGRVSSDRRLARLRGGARQIQINRALGAPDGESAGEMVVCRRRDGGNAGIGVAGLHRPHGGVCVPGRRSEIEPHRAAALVIHEQLHFLRLPGADFAQLQVRSPRPLGTAHVNPVLAAGLRRFQLDILAFAGVRAAIGPQPHAGGHVGVGGKRQREPVAARGKFLAVGADAQSGRGPAANDGPRQGRAGRPGVKLPRQYFRPVRAGRRIADHDPLHVVLAGHRGILAAVGRPAVGAAVEPQVQVVQNRVADRVRRRLVPAQHHVETARVFRHADVPERVFPATRFGSCAAVCPAVRPGPAEHAGSGRNPAQAVLRLQIAGAGGVVRREPSVGVEPGVGFDGAGHQSRPGQRRLVSKGRRRVHQQGRDAGNGGRSRTGAGSRAVARPAAPAPRRFDAHARGDHLRRQPSVPGGAVTAERGQGAAVVNRAHGEGVLGPAHVAEAEVALVALRHHVELPVAPHHGVEFALVRPAPRERAAGQAEARVDDQRPQGRAGRAGVRASRGHGEKVHRPDNAVRAASAGPVQRLGEADVAYRRGHAREKRIGEPVAGEGARAVRPVSVTVHPQVQVLQAALGRHEVGSADAVAVRRDVRVVDIESGVHEADGHRSAASAENARRTPGAQRVRAHGGNGAVVRRLDNADRLHGQHEVGLGEGAGGAGRDGGRIGADVGVEPADHGPQALQGAPPAAIGIVRHQRDEHGDLCLAGGSERGRLFEFRGHGAHGVHRLQRQKRLEPRGVSRQPGANQASRVAEDFAAKPPQAGLQLVRPGPGGQPDPAEGPVPAGAGGLPDQHIDRVRIIHPRRRRFVLVRPAGVGAVQRGPGHFAMVNGELVAVGRRGRFAAGFGPAGQGQWPRSGHDRRRRAGVAAFRLDAGGRGRRQAGGGLRRVLAGGALRRRVEGSGKNRGRAHQRNGHGQTHPKPEGDGRSGPLRLPHGRQYSPVGERMARVNPWPRVRGTERKMLKFRSGSQVLPVW